MLASIDSSGAPILRRLYDHPFFDRFATRRSRMLPVTLYLLTLLAFPAVAIVTGSYPLTLLILVPYTLASILLDGAVRGITELPARELDEREAQFKSDAHKHAYWSAALVALVLGLTAGGLRDDQGPLAAALIVSAVGFITSAPALFLALQLPD